MKLNKILIFLLILLCLTLCLGAVNASKDVTSINSSNKDIQTANSTSTEPISINKVDTEVDADDVAVEYKKKQIF